MAVFECNFFSPLLDSTCSMNVILPEWQPAGAGVKAGARRKFPTLWLLHGMGGDQTSWVRKTSIERYAADAGLAVVMPAVGKSWYQDMAFGAPYGRFLREELPAIAQSFFPLSSRRNDNFVAGLSMGGYGAFLLALSQPERFAAAASLSGALDIASNVGGDDKAWRNVIKSAFGKPRGIRGTNADLLHLAKSITQKSTPALYACCGSKDFLLWNNHTFVEHAKQIGLPLTYEEHPERDHEWGYWDEQIQQVIRWLPLRRRAL